MKNFFRKKQFFGISVNVAVIVFGLALFVSLGVSAHGNVHINDALSVSPSQLSYGAVFPEEVLLQNVLITLSTSFLRNNKLDNVEYSIKQKSKPRDPKDTSYCQNYPNDLTRCYPTLCPYLSKEPDGNPGNDTGVAAFHDPTASSSIAVGRLAKSDNDLEDPWVIDLHVPCFEGQCAQDNVVPQEYEVNPALEGEEFGCDLQVVVNKISFSHREREGTIGFWKHWNKHKTYTQAQINGWLGAIDAASGWVLAEGGYSVDTTGMVNLINDSKSCNGVSRACAKKKFLAQCLATRLNVESGRKLLTYNYSVNSSQRNYLGLTNPDALADIISAIESKLPDNGINPTRVQFLLMKNLCNKINNAGS
ncbi:MAG: hypothetical protein HYT49_01315 [Candidatus Wildermuthbacteria bacterium]|nr:hypothetical protein [Candidatus Wildermuthbacteria bacterium]